MEENWELFFALNLIDEEGVQPPTQEMLDRWHYPSFEKKLERILSFENWPEDNDQNIFEMSNAGFFYSGSSDCVICHCCGGAIADWKDSDDPWEMHALRFGNCEFLRMTIGASYIKYIQEVYQQPVDGASGSSSGKTSKNEGSVKLCKICYINDYNTVFNPCGHVVACDKCASAVTKCPVCRMRFENVMKLFFS